MCNKQGGFGEEDFVVEFLGEVGCLSVTQQQKHFLKFNRRAVIRY